MIDGLSKRTPPAIIGVRIDQAGRMLAYLDDETAMALAGLIAQRIVETLRSKAT